MRISDWSSDVCSSDLLKAYAELPAVPERRRLATRSHGRWAGRLWRRLRPNTPRITIAEPASVELQRLRRALGAASTAEPSDLCIVAAGRPRGIGRKSVVSGTRVAVRVDLGGRRIIK